MSEQIVEQYLTLDFFKKMIKSKTTQFDDLYQHIVNVSNAHVQTAISRFIEIPLGSGSIYFSRCKNAAMQYARSLHADDNELIEKSELYMKKFNIELYGAEGSDGDPKVGGLIQELIATRSDKNITILARHDPRDDNIPLPTQNDLFVSSQFG